MGIALFYFLSLFIIFAKIHCTGQFENKFSLHSPAIFSQQTIKQTYKAPHEGL